MPTVHFLGHIVPSNHIKLDVSGLPILHYHSADNNFDADLEVTVTASAIAVKCTATRYDDAVFIQLHKIGFDLARATVNLFTFATGTSLSVVFDEVIRTDGTKTAFLAQDPSLAQWCTAFTTSLPSAGEWGISDVAGVVFTDYRVFSALDDLVGAISHHHVTAINCARAIEALRHAVALPGASRDDAWKQFRQSLNIDRTYLQLITDSSKDGRHGQGTFIPGTITTEIAKRSWTIFNRFLTFRKGGNQPLTAPDFPLLSA
jgi:hypothetical protein